MTVDVVSSAIPAFAVVSRVVSQSPAAPIRSEPHELDATGDCRVPAQAGQPHAAVLVLLRRTYEDRRDWVQPVEAGFAQDNFLGMEASDYGGGTPIVDVWRRDGGLAVGTWRPRRGSSRCP